MAAWKSDVNTFEECFFTNVERWVHLYGLSYHLWSVQIGNTIGEAVALDPASTDFTRLDATRVKIKTRGSKNSFDPITVIDGVCKYKVAIYPVVLGEVIKLGVDESRWVDFGVILEEDGEANQDFLRIEVVEIGNEEILSLYPVRKGVD